MPYPAAAARGRAGHSSAAPAVLPYARLVEDQGATSHWDFRDLGGGTSADTVGGLIATPSGGVSLVDGPLAESGDKAVELDGTGYLTIPPAASLDFGTTDFWIEQWFTITDPASSYQIVWQHYDPVNGPGWIVSVGGHVDLWLSPDNVTFLEAYGAAAVDDGAPHHVVINVKRATGAVEFWIDTVLDMTSYVPDGGLLPTDSVSAPGIDTLIGAYFGGGYLTGTVTHLDAGPGSLTPEQIAARYARRAGA